MGMSVPERRVIVVGGGAAGMMASIFAGKAGARVTLLERGEKLGKKVYITGKGRCNVTNDCTLDEFLREVARNPRFLYSALSRDARWWCSAVGAFFRRRRRRAT